jgi:N-acetylmuramoyl-L-alanine amidase
MSKEEDDLLFRPCLVHRKNIARSEESDSYRKSHYNSVWNEGRDSNRSRGKTMKPAVLEERKKIRSNLMGIFPGLMRTHTH